MCRHLRPLLCTVLLGATVLAAAAPSPSRRERVEVEPTWTSIYVGTVSLRMPPFVRNSAGDFESTYVARVLPFFFYNESGRLTIHVPDEALRRLDAGEAVEFSGRAVNEKGEPRRVEGKATPAGPDSGKIKVRVFVSARIELIFNTTYRFPPP